MMLHRINNHLNLVCWLLAMVFEFASFVCAFTPVDFFWPRRGMFRYVYLLVIDKMWSTLPEGVGRCPVSNSDRGRGRGKDNLGQVLQNLTWSLVNCSEQ